DGRLLGRSHEIERLNRPVHCCTNRCKSIDCPSCKPAVCINYDDNVRGGGSEVPKAPIQGIALSNLISSLALDNLSACACRDCGCIIGTIVRYNEETVAGIQLGLDVSDGRQESCAFVVSRNEDRYSAGTMLAGLERSLRSRQRNRRNY